jgi:hypothetical protein
MIGLIAQGQKARAAEVFQSAVAFLMSVSLLILLVVGATLLLLPATTLAAPHWKVVLMLLSISVVLGLFCSLAEVVYKSTGGYAAGTYLVTTGRLVEWGRRPDRPGAHAKFHRGRHLGAAGASGLHAALHWAEPAAHRLSALGRAARQRGRHQTGRGAPARCSSRSR